MINKKASVVLGITGSIAAYKTPELIRKLQKHNLSIIPVITKNGYQFVTKTTLATLTQIDPLDDELVFSTSHIPHLSIVEQPSIIAIAPATANIIAKCAHGIADDFLSTAFLSFNGPKLIVPAMHSEMYLNPITQENISKLKKHGVHFVGPAKGDLACGDYGMGRMVEVDLLVDKILSMFLPQLQLKSKKILITCGGTTEKIDNVRVLTNLSTGRLGLKLAAIASFLGAEVGIVSTVPIPENPHLKDIVYVKNVSEMSKAVKQKLKSYEYLFMTAAVSDYTCDISDTKIKRKNSFSLELKGTQDILADLSSHKKNKTFIGFCLEDKNLKETALRKLKEKNLDFIVANTSENIGKDQRSFQIYNSKGKLVSDICKKDLNTAAYELLKLCS